MKTNSILILALTVSAHSVNAAGPAFQLKQAPITSDQNFNRAAAMPRPVAQHAAPVQMNRSSVPMIKQSAAPKNIAVHPAAPASMRSVSNPPVSNGPSSGVRLGNGTGTSPARAAGKPSIPGASGSVSTMPSIGTIKRPNITDNRLGGFTGGKGAAIRQGLDVANQVRDLKNIRNVIPEGLQQFGITGNRPAGPGAPDVRFGEDGPNSGFTGRTITNPLHRFASGKPTDIRSRMNNSGRHASSGDDLASGKGTGPTKSDAKDFNITSMTTTHPDGSTTTTVKQHDSSSRVTDYTSTTQDANSQVVRREEQHTEGGFVEVHVSTRNSDGTYSHHTYGYAPDGSGHLGNRWTSDNPYSCPPRDPEGSSAGGPVGPRVGEVIGLTSLDLLRQKAEGQQDSGGANTMTSGRIRSVHVNPGGREGNNPGTRTSDPRGHVLRNTIGSGLAGPTTGGSSGNGGGNSPD